MKSDDVLKAVRDNVGSLRQLCGVEQLIDPCSGNRIVQVRTLGGLRFEINLSRGMDIGLCEYHGLPVSWISPAGRKPPTIHNGDNWNLGFEGGLMATCGLRQAGQACDDDDEHFGPHGEISYRSAVLRRCELVLDQDPRIIVEGTVEEALPLSHHFTLRRTITAHLFASSIIVEDSVHNEGFNPEYHGILYHCNFGWPLISPTTAIKSFESTKELIKGAADLHKCLEVYPVGERAPDVILHTDIQTAGETVTLYLENEAPTPFEGKKLEARLTFHKRQCPYLTQWRHFGRGINVFAFEPGCVSTKGRAWHKKNGTMPLLAPDERRNYQLKFDFTFA